MLGTITFTPHLFPTPYDLGISWTYNPANKSKIVEDKLDLVNEVLDRVKANISIERQWNEFMKTADLLIPDPFILRIKRYIQFANGMNGRQ